MHHKWKEILDFVCKNNQWKIIGDQLPMKSLIRLKDNSNVPPSSVLHDYTYVCDIPLACQYSGHVAIVIGHKNIAL